MKEHWNQILAKFKLKQRENFSSSEIIDRKIRLRFLSSRSKMKPKFNGLGSNGRLMLKGLGNTARSKLKSYRLRLKRSRNKARPKLRKSGNNGNLIL